MQTPLPWTVFLNSPDLTNTPNWPKINIHDPVSLQTAGGDMFIFLRVYLKSIVHWAVTWIYASKSENKAYLLGWLTNCFGNFI